MSMDCVRWGIIGTGWIAHMFAHNNALVDNSTLYAVCGTSPEKSKAFCEEFSMTKAYDFLEDMLADEAVNAVYVGTPHPMHFDKIIRALEAGKHVLCAKPITMDASELEKCMTCAQENGVMLMEAMWLRFRPEFLEANRIIDSKLLGDVRRIEAHCNFLPKYDPENRLFNKKLGGGAMLDMGIYPLSLIYYFLGGGPERLLVTSQVSSGGVDLTTNVLMAYPKGVVAFFTTSLELDERQDIIIKGTLGELRIRDIFEGDSLDIDLIGKRPDRFIAPATDARLQEQHHYMIDAFVQDILSGRTDNDIMPIRESLEIMRSVDEILSFAGVDYKA